VGHGAGQLSLDRGSAFLACSAVVVEFVDQRIEVVERIEFPVLALAFGFGLGLALGHFAVRGAAPLHNVTIL
jgi:hypothetical protein